MEKKERIFEESLLIANAEKYKKQLRYCRVHERNLSLVTDGDLKIAGVDNEHTRYELLQTWKEMQMDDSSDDELRDDFGPQFHNFTINNSLRNVDNGLHMLYAYLSYAANQENIVRTDTALCSCANHLLHVANQVKDEMEALRNEVIERKPMRHRYNWKYAVTATISAMASICLIKIYFSH